MTPALRPSDPIRTGNQITVHSKGLGAKYARVIDVVLIDDLDRLSLRGLSLRDAELKRLRSCAADRVAVIEILYDLSRFVAVRIGTSWKYLADDRDVTFIRVSNELLT